MTKIWKIEGFDSNTRIFEDEMPGAMTEPEIKATLQRLVATRLELDEVVDASLRKNMRGYLPALERVGRGSPIQVGQNPYFIATRKSK